MISTATTPADHRPPRPTLEIRVLGGFAVLIEGQPLALRGWGSRKAQHLIKLLAFAPGHRVTTDYLADTLWPDLDPDAARRACYQAVYLARKVLDPDHLGLLTLHQETLTLQAPGGVSVDLDQFEAAARRAEQRRDPADYVAALARYTGEVLPDDRYAEWAVLPRETAQQRYHQLLVASASQATARGRSDEARGLWQRLLASDPANEAAHVALMRLYAAAGQRQEALTQFRQLRGALRRDLDAEPEAASQQVYAAILAGHYPEAGSRKSESGNDEGRARHNLPATTTALIGREAAIEAVRAELARARLVTLVGPGGIGKTRLALALGRALLDTYPGGVWLLDLAALHDGALLDGTLARVLGVQEQAGQPVRESIVAALRDRPALILFDNCEHLIDACADLAAALLAGCAELRLLATSREALRVAGELIWRVPSLPTPQEALDLAALRDNAAVALFLDRARFAHADFALTAENGAVVAAICRRLDGIPLAIELAAARVAILTPWQLADRLDDALRLLTGGPRTALPRHQTLRATLEWSHRLLAPDEQALLARLAVFAGGGTLAAIEVVCDPGAETLDLLAALVEKSLVQVELGAEEAPRYRLLETVRQFAAEQLAARGGEAACRARHAEYFLHLAETAEPQLRGEHQARWIARLTRDLDNLRAALAWCAAQDLASGLMLASVLDLFWVSGNYYHEGVAYLHDGLGRGGETTPTVVRARANRAIALMLTARGDPAAATFANESLGLYRALGDRNGEATCLNILGAVALHAGDYERTHAAYTKALALWRSIDYAIGIAMATANLGNLSIMRGEMAAAATSLEEILPLIRASSSQRLLYTHLANLSLSYACTERAAEARTMLRETIALMATSRDWTLYSFGGLVVAAFVANGIGEPAHAAQFLGAAAQCRATIGLGPNAWRQTFIDRATTTAQASLGEAVFAAAYAHGRSWSIEESVAQALAYLAD